MKTDNNKIKSALDAVLAAAGSSLRANDIERAFPNFDKEALVTLVASYVENEFAKRLIIEKGGESIADIPDRFVETKMCLQGMLFSADREFREMAEDCLMQAGDKVQNNLWGWHAPLEEIA
jgi:CTP:molybdopterin cytidylyltransferase MocA